MADNAKISIDLRELLEAGCHFGHQAKRWNPKMAEYIYTERDGVHVFDLAKTAKGLEDGLEFVRDFVAAGKEVVFVGTKRQAQAIVKEEAMKVGAPYVTIRWLGGTLTNWDQIKQRIKKLVDMKQKMAAGDYDAYTKKERVLISREISQLERFFGGLTNLKTRPEALFIVDTHREDTAVAEAKALEVPVVGMVDSNADPDVVTYPIPVNDDAIRSIKLVVAKMAEAYAEGKSKIVKETAAVVEEKK